MLKNIIKKDYNQRFFFLIFFMIPEKRFKCSQIFDFCELNVLAFTLTGK